MSQHWDEFSKSLAEESVPRRESLRRLGAVFAAAVLSPLGLGTALARGGDPCRAFCNECPRSLRKRCLADCQACNAAGGHVCGSCGFFSCCNNQQACYGPYCCPEGLASCGNYCADLDRDFDNCGDCGYMCDAPGAFEYGACINGRCEYACVEEARRCNGTCVDLAWDPANCGECGNVCGGSTPYCMWGTCTECPENLTNCGGYCANLDWDEANCGACGNVCPASAPACIWGSCGNCPEGQALCQGRCTDIWWDNSNCGACGNVCPPQTGCSFGVCHGGGGDDGGF